MKLNLLIREDAYADSCIINSVRVTTVDFNNNGDVFAVDALLRTCVRPLISQLENQLGGASPSC